MESKKRIGVIVVLAFGKKDTNLPNSQMEKDSFTRAKQMHREMKLDYYLSDDELKVIIARQVSATKIILYESFVADDKGTISFMSKDESSIKSSGYLDTRDVLLCVEEAFRDDLVDKMSIICHFHHRKRVEGTAVKMRLKINRVFANVDCYDRTEPQFWCRSPFVFIPMEFLKRIYYRLRGWM